jgi:hypothetical protein
MDARNPDSRPRTVPWILLGLLLIAAILAQYLITTRLPRQSSLRSRAPSVKGGAEILETPSDPPAQGSFWMLLDAIMSLPQKGSLSLTAGQADKIENVFKEYRDRDLKTAFIESEMKRLLRPEQAKFLAAMDRRFPLGGAVSKALLSDKVESLKKTAGLMGVTAAEFPGRLGPARARLSHYLLMFLLSHDLFIHAQDPVIRTTGEQLRRIAALGDLLVRITPEEEEYVRIQRVLTPAQNSFVRSHIAPGTIREEDLPDFYDRFGAFIGVKAREAD